MEKLRWGLARGSVFTEVPSEEDFKKPRQLGFLCSSHVSRQGEVDEFGFGAPPPPPPPSLPHPHTHPTTTTTFTPGDAWNLHSEATGVVGCRLDSPAGGTGALAPVRLISCTRALGWTDTHV